MSHALVVVALENAPANVSREQVHALVEEQMEPFDENGKWFADGSRWDWWVIGGRYTGALTNYDPDTDPKNWQVCRWCKGSGIRTDRICVHGCNGCSGSGKERKFETTEYKGDIIRVVDLPSPREVSAYAFLKNRRWDERSRLGWFGSETSSECERHGKTDIKRCLWKDKKTEVLICGWNEEPETWKAKFYERFLKELDPNALLVAVDYHV